MSDSTARPRLSVSDGCEGNGLCVVEAPDLLAFDDDDEYVRVLVEHPDDDQRPRAEAAVEVCPLRALSLK
jgi:ferredoxin